MYDQCCRLMGVDVGACPGRELQLRRLVLLLLPTSRLLLLPCCWPQPGPHVGHCKSACVNAIDQAAHLRPHFQHLPAARHMQLRWLRCHAVIDCQHHPLPVFCCTIPEMRADTEVVVLHTGTRNVLQPAQKGTRHITAATHIVMW